MSESVFNEGSIDVDFRVEGNTNANLLFIDGGNDRVGVGTNSVSSDATFGVSGNIELKSAGNRYYVPRQSDGAITGSLYSRTGNTITLSGAGSSSGQIEFIPSSSNSSAVAMTITSDGDIGVGTDSPGDYRLRAIATQTNQDCIYGTANGSGRGVLGYSPSGKGGYFWSDSGTGCWVGDGGLELQDSDMRLYANSADDGSRAIYFYKSQSATDKAHGGNASMDAGDDIGLIGFLGSEQSGWRWGAKIYAEVGIDWDDDSPTDLVFSVTPNGSYTATERMRITSTGYIVANGASDYPRASRGNVFKSSANGNAAITLLSPSNHSAGVGQDIVALNFAANNYWGDNKDAVYAQIKCQNDNGSYADRGRLVFATGYNGDTLTNRMYVDSSGNVGIGAASFGPRLYSIVASAEYAAYFTSDDPTSTNAAALGVRADYGSGTRVMQVFFDGGNNLGEITYNGSAITYGGTSDERLKKDISSYTGGLSIINQMGVKNFTWKEHDKKDVGLIAQELYDILPSRVVEGTGEDEVDRPWQVDYPRLVPYLINAIQELSTKVTALKGN